MKGGCSLCFPPFCNAESSQEKQHQYPGWVTETAQTAARRPALPGTRPGEAGGSTPPRCLMWIRRPTQNPRSKHSMLPQTLFSFSADCTQKYLLFKQSPRHVFIQRGFSMQIISLPVFSTTVFPPLSALHQTDLLFLPDTQT